MHPSAVPAAVGRCRSFFDPGALGLDSGKRQARGRGRSF